MDDVREPRRRPIVGIDGPAGAGKSTVAEKAAAQLGFVLISTGLIYRVILFACMDRRIDLNDSKAVETFARELISKGELVISRDDRTMIIELWGRHMTPDELSTSEISDLTPKVAGYADVREIVLEV